MAVPATPRQRELAHGAAQRAQATSLRPNSHAQFINDFAAYELSVGRARRDIAKSLEPVADFLPEKPVATNASRLARGLARELNFGIAARNEMRFVDSLFDLDALVSRFPIEHRSVGRDTIRSGHLLDSYLGDTGISIASINPIQDTVVGLLRSLDAAAREASKKLPAHPPRTFSKAGRAVANQLKRAELKSTFATDESVGRHLEQLDTLINAVKKSPAWKRSEQIIKHEDDIRSVSRHAAGLAALELNEGEFFDDWRTYLGTQDGRAVASQLGFKAEDARSIIREVSRLEGLSITPELGRAL